MNEDGSDRHCFLYRLTRQSSVESVGKVTHREVQIKSGTLTGVTDLWDLTPVKSWNSQQRGLTQDLASERAWGKGKQIARHQHENVNQPRSKLSLN